MKFNNWIEIVGIENSAIGKWDGETKDVEFRISRRFVEVWEYE